MESKVAVQGECQSKSELEFALAPLAADFDFECELAFQHPKKCSQTPLGTVPGGTLDPPPREHPEGPEKDPFCQVVNYQHTVGDSSRK